MAHFAELDENNKVLRVLVVNNTDILDQNGQESEIVGAEFLKNIFGQNTIWKQTSYNANFRVRPAAIDYYYDENYDAFIAPKTYNSWTFNEEDLFWQPPIPYPNDGNDYVWNESLLQWDLII